MNRRERILWFGSMFFSLMGGMGYDKVGIYANPWMAVGIMMLFLSVVEGEKK